jgi:hypothetical protein
MATTTTSTPGNKRLVSETIYQSDKLYSVPEDFRPEYPWIIPMVKANGCMEYNVPVIWRTAYSLMRPDVNRETLQKVFEAFVEAKLVFPFKHSDGKSYIFFIGMEKSGLLPCKSEREKYAEGKSIVPAKELAKFLNLKPKDVQERFASVIAQPLRGISESSQTPLPKVMGNDKVLGNDNVEAPDRANDNAEGKVLVNGNDKGHAHGQDESERDKTDSFRTSSQDEQDEQDEQGGQEGQNEQESIPAPFQIPELAKYLAKLLSKNSHCTSVPKSPEKAWENDFKTLLQTYSYAAVRALIGFSQQDSQKQYFVRPKNLLDNGHILRDRFKIPTLTEENAGKRVPGLPQKVEPKPFECPECEFTHKQGYRVAEHIEKEHPKLGKFRLLLTCNHPGCKWGTGYNTIDPQSIVKAEELLAQHFNSQHEI